MMNRKTFTTDLSDWEWQIIEPLLPGPKQLGRKIESGYHGTFVRSFIRNDFYH
jgi:transposase